MQDPAIYLNEIGVELAGCVDTLRPAVISDDYRVLLGFESFFFADSTALQTFLSDVPRYCGVLTDPVSKERFRPDRDSPRIEYNNRPYLFASASTQSLFEATSDMYFLPNYQMLPRDSTAQAASSNLPPSGRPKPPAGSLHHFSILAPPAHQSGSAGKSQNKVDCSVVFDRIAEQTNLRPIEG